MPIASALLSCAVPESIRSVSPGANRVDEHAASATSAMATMAKRARVVRNIIRAKLSGLEWIGASLTARPAFYVATPTRFERVASGLGILRSILLSYGVVGAST